jgi:transcriptional regulator with XRE-family HTH domain
MPRRTLDDPVAQAFGRALRSARDAKGLKLSQVAQRAAETSSGKLRPDSRYLGELERGYHSCTITTAKVLADALGVPLAELVRDLQ